MKRTTLLILISVLSVIALAHEYWLHPQRFFYTIRETANIRFVVGEYFTGKNWKGNKDRIVKLVHYTPSEKKTDISSLLSSNSGDSLQLPLREEGTHMVTFNSTNSFIKLNANKFNAYLKDAGLDDISAYRKEHNEENKDGTEEYLQSIKTILQVSDKLNNTCIEPTDLPLDIIPEENPYSIPVLDNHPNPLKVKFRVLFKGKPLNNALVRIWYYSPGKKTAMDSLRTNKRGWIVTDRHSGPFLVSCVQMERNLNGKGVDWQSYRGSLSFEYSQFFTGKNAR